MVGLGITLTCVGRHLLLPQSRLVQHQWLLQLEQSFLHHPWNFWIWNKLYNWLIESTMIPVTLEPTNDAAVHNQMLHSYLYFLFVLQSCVKLLHERTNTQCTKALKKYRSLVTGCLMVAALSTDSLSMTSSSSPWSVVTNLSISIIPLWSFFLSNR